MRTFYFLLHDMYLKIGDLRALIYTLYLLQTQFVVMGSHTFYNFVTECNYPTFLKIVHMVYMITLIVLFSNFYIKSYTRKPKKISPPPSGTGEPDSNVNKKRQ